MVELKSDGVDIPDKLSCTFLDLPDKKTAVKNLLEVFNSKTNPINEEAVFEWLEHEDLEKNEINIDWLNVEVEDKLEEEELLPNEEQDDVPELKKEPFVVHGDIFEIKAQGLKYKIGCLDSISVNDVEKLMDGEKANMIFTDPPYNMNFTGSVHGDGSKENRFTGIKNDKMSNKEFQDFLDGFCTILNLYVTGAFYITFYRLGIDWMFEALNRNNIKTRNLIIWKKNNFNLSKSDYKSFYEPVFYGWLQNHDFYGEKNETDIWEINKTKINDLHPTMKPVELCERAILNSSKKTNNILDLFAGSGSTLIACIKTKRNCFTCDIDKHYTQVTVKRAVDFLEKNNIKFKITLNNKNFDLKNLKSE